ncbi:U3 snoRNP protein [Cladophialophora chaetospira]|uniref:U3 snoRNP protein n=1 Tax=Cladophialophora chaetospira TaxID=386627 RepID=A0AA38WZQ6_9EURO|nr:U3 snoRNP protein [Cladophialophora chaetospira]
MAAASDKARFFLEQSVPELKEYERKGIFSAEEITSIARKRSDFEHKINARGSTPTDYARYAEFEINVDALRRKRVKRLGIKSTAHNGRRRVFFVFDRGTRKHPGDVTLWMEAIDFARKQKAYKKLQEMFTQVLRLHPTKSDLWIHAAQYAVEDNGDMTEARSYMQRGLRFCKSSRLMWLEYGRLEMSYISKIHARREILGIAAEEPDQAQEQEEEEDENIIKLPSLTAMDVNPEGEEHEVDKSALETLGSTPALGGAIPIAVFDAAMDQFDDPKFGFDFFGMLLDFDHTSACKNVASHVGASLLKRHPQHWRSQACEIQLPLISVSPSSPEFPQAFRKALWRLREVRQKSNSRELVDWARDWLEKLMQREELDPAIKMVGESVIRTLSAAGSAS